MTVQELIQQLEGMEPDAEVRLAQQPSWPFEYSLSEITTVEPGDGFEIVRDNLGDGEGWYVQRDDEYEDGPFETCEEAEACVAAKIGEETEPVVYLGEGTQLGYLPAAAKRALGW